MHHHHCSASFLGPSAGLVAPANRPRRGSSALLFRQLKLLPCLPTSVGRGGHGDLSDLGGLAFSGSFESERRRPPISSREGNIPVMHSKA